MIVRKSSMFFVFGLCCLLLFAATAIAGDISDPILKKLVEKGVLTKQEAKSVMQEMEKEAVEKDKAVEKKIIKTKTADSYLKKMTEHGFYSPIKSINELVSSRK